MGPRPMNLGHLRVSPERVAKGLILLGVVYPVSFYGPDNTYSLIAGFVVLVTLWRFRTYVLDGQFVDTMVFCLSTILGVIVGIGCGNIAATALPLFPGFNHVAGIFLSTVCIITLMLSLIEARVTSAFLQSRYISLIRVFARVTSEDSHLLIRRPYLIRGPTSSATWLAVQSSAGRLLSIVCCKWQSGLDRTKCCIAPSSRVDRGSDVLCPMQYAVSNAKNACSTSSHSGAVRGVIAHRSMVNVAECERE